MARIYSGADGFLPAVAASGLDVAANTDVVFFVVRGVVNTKHINEDEEEEIAVRILTALFSAAGAGPVTPAVRLALSLSVAGIREVLRTYGDAKKWRSRG